MGINNEVNEVASREIVLRLFSKDMICAQTMVLTQSIQCALTPVRGG
jgi:hypothetical protein